METRETTRADWPAGRGPYRADLLLVGLAVIGVLLTWALLLTEPASSRLLPHGIGLAAGIMLAVSLWWRHRAPLTLVIITIATAAFDAAFVPQLIALFSVARIWPRASWVTGVALVTATALARSLRDAGAEAFLFDLVVYTAIVGTVLATAIASTRRHRSLLDWLADTGVYLVAWLVNLVVLAVGIDEGMIEVSPWLARDLFVVVGITVALWFRDEWPVPIALAGIVVAPSAQFGVGTFLVASFAVAARRRPAIALAVAAGFVAATALHVILVDVRGLPLAIAIMIAGLGYGGVVGWGLVARSRRALVDSLRERARQAQAEQELRVERARQLERERIAREMHDVLAHRLSLLSVHAGAVEYRPGAPPDEIATTAGVIRQSAHQALNDLREIIGVLRAGTNTGPHGDGGNLREGDPAEGAEQPQPTLADLDRLVAEVTRTDASAINPITSDVAVDPTSVPERIGRTTYRIVQEALTNARKHAPGTPVTIRIGGVAGTALTVEVANHLPEQLADGAPIPGAHTGLIGLRERVNLVGGTFDSGIDHGTGVFAVHARLPWPA